MQSFYVWLADGILLVHTAFILWVVLALPVTIVGGLAKAKWVRNPWFRWSHLAMIGVVVFETLINFECPLTTWENMLRELAHEETYRSGFIAGWMDRLFYFVAPDWVFDVCYTVFGVLVLGTFLLWPPRRFSRSRAVRQDSSPSLAVGSNVTADL